MADATTFCALLLPRGSVRCRWRIPLLSRTLLMTCMFIMSAYISVPNDSSIYALMHNSHIVVKLSRGVVIDKSRLISLLLPGALLLGAVALQQIVRASRAPWMAGKVVKAWRNYIGPLRGGPKTRRQASLYAWLLANLAWFVLPALRRRLMLPYWVVDHPGRKVPGSFLVLMYSAGSAAGWPSLWNLGLSLISSQRTYSWLTETLGWQDEDMVQLMRCMHEWSGHAAVFWVSVHGVLCQLPMLATSSHVWVQEMLPSPRGWYTGGAVNLSGLLSWVLLLLVWSTSLPVVRRRCFNTFQVVHVLWFLVIYFAVLHDEYTTFFLCVGWITHLTERILKRWHWSTIVPAAMTVIENREDLGLLQLQLLLPQHMLPTCPGAYFLLKVSEVNFWERHPFTIAHVRSHHGHAGDLSLATVYIKVEGDWGRRVMQMAASHGPKLHLEAYIEGPYGGASRPPGCNVVLVAGGIGITRFLHLLQSEGWPPEHGRSEAHPRLAGISLLWIARSSEVAMFNMVLPHLQEAAAAGATIHIHKTRLAATQHEMRPKTFPCLVPLLPMVRPMVRPAPTDLVLRLEARHKDGSCSEGAGTSVSTQSPVVPEALPFASTSHLDQHARVHLTTSSLCAVLLVLTTLGFWLGYLSGMWTCSSHPPTPNEMTFISQTAGCDVGYTESNRSCTPPAASLHLRTSTRFGGQYLEVCGYCSEDERPEALQELHLPCCSLAVPYYCSRSMPLLLACIISVMLGLCGYGVMVMTGHLLAADCISCVADKGLPGLMPLVRYICSRGLRGTCQWMTRSRDDLQVRTMLLAPGWPQEKAQQQYSSIDVGALMDLQHEHDAQSRTPTARGVVDIEGHMGGATAVTVTHGSRAEAKVLLGTLVQRSSQGYGTNGDYCHYEQLAEGVVLLGCGPPSLMEILQEMAAIHGHLA